MNIITHRQLEEAKQIIEQGIKSGYLNESDFLDLSDEEYVEKVGDLIDYVMNEMEET